MSHADMTWYPTLVFMEYLLPRNMSWPESLLDDSKGASPTEPVSGDSAYSTYYAAPANGYLNNLRTWYCRLHREFPEQYAKTRKEIWDFWAKKDTEGQFDDIRNEEITDASFKWVYP